MFGITNDKQTVRPIEDLWRLFALEEIDAQLGREQTFQRKMRREERLRQQQGQAEKAAEPTFAETAAAAADGMSGQKPRIADRVKARVREAFEEEADARSRIDASSIEAARRAIEEEAKKRPYVVDFYDEPRGPFYKPDWLNGSQIGVLINRQHPFFQTLYSPLLRMSGGTPAKQALDILLIALARAELSVENDETANWYLTQRERAWSDFLNDAYKALQQKIAPADEESAETDDDQEGGDAALEAAE